VLYLRQQISTLLVAVITEVIKRVEMRTIMGFVALFVPIRLPPCTIRPLADAALDLIITSTTCQHPG
jgi:hypothetical protein